MKIMVLGSGSREHAIAWKLAQSTTVQRVFVGPGNAGTAAIAQNLPDVSLTDFPSIAEAVRANGIDCVFVGPEVPLAAGVVDFLGAQGIPAIGPNKACARLESSKAFSKAFLLRNGIPTADAREFSDFGAFESYVSSRKGQRLVVKKSGLAAGKGVLESSDISEIVPFGKSVLASDRLLVEEFLKGWEVSIFGVSDGKTHIVLPPCTDFKKAHDGDTGPNTGGMGSICPVPWVDEALFRRIRAEIVEPTYAALARDGLAYAGILYFGLMICADGPKVLEFNVRLGDPEAQVLLPVLDLDVGELTEALVNGTLGSRFPNASTPLSAALGVVVASRGYPESSQKGVPVEIDPDDGSCLIFHASTSCDAAGRVLTGGGRCFTVVGTGKDLAEASQRAYASVGRVRFDGAWHRGDIGAKFMGRASGGGK